MSNLIGDISKTSIKHFLNFFSNQILINHPYLNICLAKVQNFTGLNKRYPLYLVVATIFLYLLFARNALFVGNTMFFVLTINYCYSKYRSPKDEQKKCAFFLLCYLATLLIDYLMVKRWFYRLYLCTKFWSLYFLWICLLQNKRYINVFLDKIPGFSGGQIPKKVNIPIRDLKDEPLPKQLILNKPIPQDLESPPVGTVKKMCLDIEKKLTKQSQAKKLRRYSKSLTEKDFLHQVNSKGEVESLVTSSSLTDKASSDLNSVDRKQKAKDEKSKDAKKNEKESDKSSMNAKTVDCTSEDFNDLKRKKTESAQTKEDIKSFQTGEMGSLKQEKKAINLTENIEKVDKNSEQEGKLVITGKSLSDLDAKNEKKTEQEKEKNVTTSNAQVQKANETKSKETSIRNEADLIKQKESTNSNRKYEEEKEMGSLLSVPDQDIGTFVFGPKGGKKGKVELSKSNDQKSKSTDNKTVLKAQLDKPGDEKM